MESQHTVAAQAYLAPSEARSGSEAPSIPSRTVFRVVVLGLAAYQTVLSLSAMNPDGMSYLDMGDALIRGNWQIAVNGYWSPLYPVILGVAGAVTRPSPRWEFAIVHAVNWLILLAALIAFEFYWSSVTRIVGRAGGDRIAFSWIGYGLFIWATLILVTTTLVTPDLCAVALIMTATGLTVRILEDSNSRLRYVLLGLVLGLGYLAKAAVFPIAGLFFAAIAWQLKSRHAVWFLVTSVLVFICTTAPWIAATSYRAGRLTISDSASLNYVWAVEGNRGMLPPHEHLEHPVRKLMDDPAVYEFGGPMPASYPYWFAPSYWMKGVQPRFQVMREIQTVADDCGRVLQVQGQVGWLCLALFLLLIRDERSPLLSSVPRLWCVLVPGLGAIALFVLVHVTDRYVAPFLIMVWTAVLAGLICAASSGPGAKRVLRAVALSTIAGAALVTVLNTAAEARKPEKGDGSYLVAAKLHDLGIRRGDAVASIGDTPYAFWARLGRVHIVAEIPRTQASRFWAMDPVRRHDVELVFLATGARAIVADDVPGNSFTNGWIPVDKTGYYVLLLGR